MIPFTSADFLRMFEQYNNAIWPGQVALCLVALIAIALAFTRRPLSSKLISLILALLWLWMGVVYHLVFFSTINKAARLFAVLFIIQSVIFVSAGIVNSSLSFEFRSGAQGLIGAGLITYSLVVYPIAGAAFGHTYPAAPTFGVPCPTTIFTFGMLVGAGINVRFYILIIPLLWSLLGLWAAISLGMYEDFGLVVAGLIAARAILRHSASRGLSLDKWTVPKFN